MANLRKTAGKPTRPAAASAVGEASAVSAVSAVSAATATAVHQSLTKLGADLNASRRRWRLSLAEVAERAGTCRQTISRIENGDPRVAMGTWASVLLSLRLLDRLTDLAAPTSKLHAAMIAIEQLPTRVRGSKRYGT